MNLKPQIREFNPQDQQSARSVILAGLKEHFGTIDEARNPDLEDIEKYYISNRNVFIVAEVQQNIIGTGALIIKKNGVAHVVRMSVLKEYRRDGIGTLMLNYLIQKAKSLKLKKLMLETELNWHEAIEFYKKIGFVEYKRDSVDVFMTLDLSKYN